MTLLCSRVRRKSAVSLAGMMLPLWDPVALAGMMLSLGDPVSLAGMILPLGDPLSLAGMVHLCPGLSSSFFLGW